MRAFTHKGRACACASPPHLDQRIRSPDRFRARTEPAAVLTGRLTTVSFHHRYVRDTHAARYRVIVQRACVWLRVCVKQRAALSDLVHNEALHGAQKSAFPRACQLTPRGDWTERTKNRKLVPAGTTGDGFGREKVDPESDWDQTGTELDQLIRTRAREWKNRKKHLLSQAGSRPV